MSPKFRNFLTLILPLLFVANGGLLAQTPEQAKIDSIQLVLDKTQNKDSILSLLSQQLALAEKLGDAKQQAQIEVKLGVNSDYDGFEMEEHIKRAIVLYEELNDTAGVIAATYQLANAKQLQGEYDSTIHYSNKLILLAEDAADTASIIRARLLLSSVHNHQSNYEASLQELNKSRRIAEMLEDNLSLTLDIYNRESFIYYSLQEFDKSAERIEKIIEALKASNNQRRLNLWHNNLASVYSLCGNCVSYEKRKQILKQSIEYGEAANFSYGLAYAYKHLSDVYREEGKRDSTRYYLDQIEVLLPSINKRDFTGLVSVAQGFYWEQGGNKPNAIKYYGKAHDIWAELGKKREQMDMAWNLGHLYESTGDFKKANRYLYTYVSLRDSLYDVDNVRKIKELEMNYEFRQQQVTDSLKNLEQVNLLEYEAAAQKKTKNLLIIGVLLVLIVSIIVFNSLLKQKKLGKLLKVKSAQVESELAQKELLLTEIHHRVKNNFQILSSLLELQAKGTDDQQTKELISEGKSRVRSMALIHAQLYQKDSLAVKLHDYLQNLVAEIQKSFTGSTGQVNLNVSEETTIDVDSMVPLGLIANELVVNAFKYADGQTDELKLEINLYEEGGFQVLMFKDNGPGLPENLDLATSKSTGLWLVSRLALQLHGKSEYVYENGAMFKVYFKQSEFLNS